MKNIAALILCGGKGTRLGTLGGKTPKSLLKLKKYKIIDLIIKHLKKYAINQIYISGNYKFNLIKKHINNNYYKEEIFLRNDGDIEIIKRIEIALNQHKDKKLLVCYGDAIANVNIKKLYKSHLKENKKLTITTYSIYSNFGFLMKKSKNKYIFKEKPKIGNINIGFMILDYNNIDIIKKKKKFENYLKYMAETNQINEYNHKGNHITVNTLEELNLANKKIKEFKI